MLRIVSPNALIAAHLSYARSRLDSYVILLCSPVAVLPIRAMTHGYIDLGDPHCDFLHSSAVNISILGRNKVISVIIVINAYFPPSDTISTNRRIVLNSIDYVATDHTAIDRTIQLHPLKFPSHNHIPP